MPTPQVTVEQVLAWMAGREIAAIDFDDGLKSSSSKIRKIRINVAIDQLEEPT